MSNFYIKSGEGKYIPIEMKKLIDRDLDKSLIVVRVGTDQHPASLEDIEVTEHSFRQADIIDDLDVSIILTPYQLEIGVVEKEEDLNNKQLYLQISGGDNIGELEEAIKSLYSKIKNKFNVAVLPTPLTVKDYKKMKDILTRCRIRQSRRGRIKG